MNFRFHLSLGLITLCFFIAFIGLWALTTNISGAIIANGRTITNLAAHIVSHPQGGLIDELHVSEGQFVQEGQLLAEINAEELNLKIGSKLSRLTTLYAIKARLQSELSGQSLGTEALLAPNFIKELDEFQGAVDAQELIYNRNAARLEREINVQAQRVSQIQAQVRGLDIQIAAANAELEILSQEVNRLTGLKQEGLALQRDLTTTAREFHRMTSNLGKMQSQQAELLEKIKELEIVAIGLQDKADILAQNGLDKVEREIVLLSDEIADLRLRREFGLIRAPISGIVYDIAATGRGYAVRAGSAILTIVPAETGIRAIVKVSPADIDQVYPEQDAQINITAYGARSRSKIMGAVVGIAPEVQLDPVTRKPHFEVLLEFESLAASGYSEDEIINGMELVAFLATESETPFEYISRPIRNYFRYSLRDR